MKIAFIVQPDWLEQHFGVRNLFVSLYKILEKYGVDVEFITFQQYMNRILWYRNVVADADLKSNIKITTTGTRKSYKYLTEKKKFIPNKYQQYLGEDIKDIYDGFIITNPWLINSPIVLGKKSKKILICHDVVANKLTLLKDINIKKWGFAHNTGYQYALINNLFFLSNSRKTDEEIEYFYNPSEHSYLKPVLTYSFFDVDYDSNQQKENAIVLAAPFDERKGLKMMPDILNKLVDDIDTLYIYGTPRCGSRNYKEFYKKLKIKNVIHYDEITSENLINLYKKCKILLFPSLEEGLGIPLLEAQVCGCRVVTTNKQPMNELCCSGSYLLTDDIEKDVNEIKKMLADNEFDYQTLSKDAADRFSIEHIYKELVNILEK